jgi:alanyl-tRNA synthetase
VEAAHAEGRETISGRDAFVLWTQDGFPYDLIRDIAEENGLAVDRIGFDAAMEEHRLISGRGAIGELDVDTLRSYSRILEELQRQGRLPPEGVHQHYGEDLELATSAVGLLRLSGDDGSASAPSEMVKRARSGDRVGVILAETPFYVESGGQVSDTGYIHGGYQEGDAEEPEPKWAIEVDDVRRPVPGLVVHLGTVKSGTVHPGAEAWAIVDGERRMDIARNHTATHLLHGELRYVLGQHVQQAGSLVAPDRLRFDFSHGAMLTQDQLSEVERLVNAAILADYPVLVVYEDYADAVAEGAMALFGEKYGERVRVIKVGYEEDEFSKELCGGTHVAHTSQIGFFRILSESSVAAGIRRIEAVTGSEAQRLAQDRLDTLDQAAAYLGCQAEEVGRKVLSLLEQEQALRKEIDRLNRRIARQSFEGVLEQAQDVEGVPVLATEVDAASVENLREMCDWFRERIGSGVVVLGAVISGRPSIVAAVTPDLVQRGLDAGRLVQQVARVVGGGGGGRSTMAHAGGRDPDRLDEALQLVHTLVRGYLTG